MTSQKQRVSPNKLALDGIERYEVRDRIIKKLLFGEITQGQALRTLRVQVLGLNQQRYIQMVKVSRQTLSDVENDKGNYSVETINQIFKPMGLQLGIVPINKTLLTKLFPSE